ncbi:MAG: sodium:proton antiporter [Planctomycetes bacterium]|nr:sodium:proton antiporter [Planctomycetota bacterium]
MDSLRKWTTRLTASMAAVALFPAVALAAEGHAHMPVAMWSIIPFAVLLLGIAIIPLTYGHWWEHNTNKLKVALLLGLPVLLYLLFQGSAQDRGENRLKLIETMMEYVAFIALLGSLFVISGGILVTGSLRGRPVVNTAILALGGILASFIGTTGAAMLLIRPTIRANAHRAKKAHIIIFFTFIVANCGGMLTPLGDPPLFLGFLKGVPFAWTLRLLPQWAMVNALLLVIFYVWDTMASRGDAPAPADGAAAPLGIKGAFNILLLGGVIATVVASAEVEKWYHHSRFHGIFEARTREAMKDQPAVFAALNAYAAGAAREEMGKLRPVLEKKGVKEGDEAYKQAEEHAMVGAQEKAWEAFFKGDAEHFRGQAPLVVGYRAAEANNERVEKEWMSFEYTQHLLKEAVVKGFQVAVMLLLAWASLFRTPWTLRQENGFSWAPIQEVAYLFIGIFVTMIPALIVLNVRGGDIVTWAVGDLATTYGGDQAKFLSAQLPLFFWLTGGLSSFLDNAPTYLVFLSTAQGLGTQGVDAADLVVGVPNVLLEAIACGAVMMGANTYIGNGPNFMVKAIAEEAKIKMPSFFGYMAYSIGILIPTFIAVTFIFFMRGVAR